MENTKRTGKLPDWARLLIKIILTVILLQVLIIIEMLLLMLASLSDMSDIGLQLCFIFIMPIPLLPFGLIWLPKRKPFMLALGAALSVLIIGATICFGVYNYEQSLIIDTAPSIRVREYLPFEENSKIVKLRSETLEFELQDDVPVIDGAAALFPVYSAFVNATYPTNTVLNGSMFKYNNTPAGYRALAQKSTDIFIGVYPSEEQISFAESCGTHFTYTPIGYDAFVFFVHKDNPIESLTADQLRAIYAGEITNWKELGGRDEEIVAYQRNEGSGSQSMLLRFMDGKEPTDAPSDTVNSMGGIIEQVADYKSVTASIGFSFRFYVEGIIKNPDIKMIAIDGVAPTAENVRNELYPIRTPFYAVTYEENANPNTRRLIDWMLSDEGQYIIEKTGYVGVGK